MPRGIKVSQDLKDEILMKVASYQSEKKATLKKSFEVVADKYGVPKKTIHHWYYKSLGKNPVISTVAKKKDKPTKIAATSLSTSSSKMEAERMIFEYIKKLSLFKRILACIIGIDKLCWNYGSKKMD